MTHRQPPAEVRCPECLGELPDESGMAGALLENGCVYCGADLTSEALSSAR